MKIAILTTGSFIADGVGGIHTMIDNTHNWLIRNGHKSKVFNYCPKIPKRITKKTLEKPSKVNYEYTSYDMNMASQMVDEINTYDAVLFIKEAYMSGGFTFESLNALYHKIWKKITIKKIFWQQNGLPRSLDKMPYSWGMVNEADTILYFATESDYINDIVAKLPGKKERVKKFIVGMDFSQFDGINRENLDRENKIIFVGRPVSIKEPYRLLEMAPLLQEAGIKSEMHGIDNSMAGLNYVLNRENAIDHVRAKGQKEGITDVYGPYERKEAFEFLQKSLFGCSFFNYRKKKEHAAYYGDRMEYAMMEIIACGCIPVFDRHWGENCRTKEGVRYIDIPNFAIFSKFDDHEATVKEMIKVMNDKELQNKIRKTSYEVTKKENDINRVMADLLEIIENTTKDENKFKTERELVEYVTKDSELAEKFEKVMNEGYLMHMGPSSLMKGRVCSLPERTNKKLIEH